jgi:hypothetical protein
MKLHRSTGVSTVGRLAARRSGAGANMATLRRADGALRITSRRLLHRIVATGLPAGLRTGTDA